MNIPTASIAAASARSNNGGRVFEEAERKSCGGEACSVPARMRGVGSARADDLGHRAAPLNLYGIGGKLDPSDLTPAQVRHAYGFDQIPFLQGDYNGLAGKGETIAIVDTM